MKICFTATLVFYAAFALGQIDNPNNLRAQIFELKVKTIPPENLQLPFETIKIIDSRPDTSKLGFMISRKIMIRVSKVFERILLNPGIEKGIENFYNEYYKNNFTSNGKTLLISVRKLWVNSMPGRQAERQRKDISRSSQMNIYAKFEYYIGSENAYAPIKRIDTVFQLTPQVKIEAYDPANEAQLPFLCYALEKMVENVNYGLYTTDPGKKPRMSVEEIHSYNAANKNIPILNEPLQKGVFLTFDEFKNNRPSIKDFNKRKISKSSLYEITDKNDNVILHYFAYHNGNTLAIFRPLSSVLGSRYWQGNYGIYKVGDSFQFFEATPLSSKLEVGVVDNSSLEQNSRMYSSNLVWVPRQIDLETGEVY